MLFPGKGCDRMREHLEALRRTIEASPFTLRASGPATRPSPAGTGRACTAAHRGHGQHRRGGHRRRADGTPDDVVQAADAGALPRQAGRPQPGPHVSRRAGPPAHRPSSRRWRRGSPGRRRSPDSAARAWAGRRSCSARATTPGATIAPDFATVVRDGRGWRAVPDRRRAALRPLRRSRAGCARRSRRRDRLPAAGPPGLAAPHASHGRAACQRCWVRCERRVLVPVRGRGAWPPGDGTSPRRAGRRVLASARGSAHGHARPARRARARLQDLAVHGRTPGRGWRTLDLVPGTLFHLPPWTPHDVVCHGRSLALSLTWRDRDARERRARRGPRARAGRVGRRLRLASTRSRRSLAARLWTQMPAIAAPRRGGAFDLVDARRRRSRLPAAARRRRTHRLAAMPSFAVPPRGVAPRALAPCSSTESSSPQDLPLRIVPTDPQALDGWRFR